MNHVYRIIWSVAANTYIAVAETAGSRGKRSLGKRMRALRALALAASLITGANALANPTGGAVSAGQGSIVSSGTVTTINQATPKMAINWQGFNIAAGETVNFVQPGSSAVALNRVLGTDGSQLLGRMNANGQVYILNPNGVLFGKDAQVSVGALVASTLQMSDSDFMAGKTTFSGPGGAVTNYGNIMANGGYVSLLGGQVSNQGTITAKLGTVALGAGQKITLDFSGDGLLNLAVDQGLANALTDNRGLIQADGGSVIMAAQTADALRASVVNNEGVIQARSLENHGGVIRLAGTQVRNAGSLDASGTGGADGGRIDVNVGYAMFNSGSLNASGAQGGSISVTTHNLIDAGRYDASGTVQGGSISLAADHHIEQTVASTLNADSSSGQGGTIRIIAGGDAWLSGRASASGRLGGAIAVTAPELVLAGAQLGATGQDGGGRIRVGGGWQGGDADLPNAARARLVDTQLDVSASGNGDGGTAVIWSDQATLFGGQVKANGGAAGGNGGKVEVSSHGQLTFGGSVDTAAAKGRNGQLLLDPQDIEIVAEVAATSVLPIENTAPQANAEFGSGSLLELKSGNTAINRIAIAAPLDNTNATGAGAVRLYNSQTGALQSVISGQNPGDNVGSGGMTLLTNGNVVVASPNYSNLGPSFPGPIGAVTWMDASVPYSSPVSSSNSLTGSSSGDSVGSNGVTALTNTANGNYVVAAPHWHDGLTSEAGAVIWANGSVRSSGAITANNSLHGVNTGDQIGSGGITALANGNYVVVSPNWANGSTVPKAGAVTLMSGSNGGIGGGLSVTVAGAVVGGTVGGGFNPGNSATGSITNDQVGSGGITPLANGNFVVSSPLWNNNIANNRVGAVTLVTSGMNVPVATTNSLYGTIPDDRVGSGGVTALPNGNYVIVSPKMDVPNGASLIVDGGAVTWASGTSVLGTQVVPSNSLVGGNAKDQLGSGGVKSLANGNYLVLSPLWNNNGSDNADQATGAVTFAKGGNTDVRVVGFLSSSNSLTGSTFGDKVGNGGVTLLNNQNYVVSSNVWNRPAAGPTASAAKVGAVTWGSGADGVTGVVSASNSQIGKIAGDMIGSGGITALDTGNDVVASPNYGSASLATNPTTGLGAVTFNPGNLSTTGVLSESSSLLGLVAGDMVGSGGVTALGNGNYVVASPSFAVSLSGTTYTSAGAVTWGNGASGTSGIITSANSLVGSHNNDRVGNLGVTALSNGNYVVASGAWGNAQAQGGNAASFGAVTFGKGATADGGVSGIVSSANSLTGNGSATAVGFFASGVSGVVALKNGDYLVRSPFWYTGGTGVGAVTWGSGTVGVHGIVSTANSFTGSTEGDQVGSGAVLALSDGRALVASPVWDAPGKVNAGRVDILGEQSATTFATNPVGKSTIITRDLQALLKQSASVTLQANNDITLAANSPLQNNNAVAGSGKLVLQAGRSIRLNSPIDTSSDLTLIANESTANGVIRGSRIAGTAVITMANGATINAAGNVDIAMHDGAGLNDPSSGSISLGAISANRISVVNGGPFPDADGARIVVGGALHASAASGDGIVLAGGVFRNDAGSAALTTDGSRWLVWSGSPAAAGENRGGLAYDFKQYNAQYGSSQPASSSGNGVLYTIAPRLEVGLTGTVSKVYDGTANATVNPANLEFTGGNIDGDVVILNNNNALSGSYLAGLSGAAKDVGNPKDVSVNGFLITSAHAGNNAAVPVFGYGLMNTAASAGVGSISAAPLTLSTGDVSKVYDGSLAANGTPVVAGGTLYGDTLSGGTYAYLDKNVGSGKSVSASGITVNDGNGGSNYAVSYVNNTGSVITPAPLTLSSADVNKVYDGGLAAKSTPVVTSGTLFGDTLSGGTYAYLDRNVGSGKSVSASAITVNDGNGGGNYAVSYVNNTHSVITPAPLTLSTGDVSKVYDGGLAANGTPVVTSGTLFGDTISGGMYAYLDKNAGTGKSVSASAITVNDGNGGANYAVSYVHNTHSVITPAPLTLSTGDVSKVYDGGLAANGTPVVISGTLFGDTINGGTYAYLDRNAGSGKSVSANAITVNDGNGGANYAFSYVNNTNSVITPAPLALSTTTVNKLYDGNVSAAGTPLVTGGTLYGGDTISDGSFAFTDRYVGSNKTVVVSDIKVNDGNGGANYSVSTANNTSSSISASPQVIAATEQAGAIVASTLQNPKLSGADRRCILDQSKCIAALGGLPLTISGAGMRLPESLK